MIVIADSSPFIALLNIGHVDILPRMYGSIIIPTEVASELLAKGRPHVVQVFMSSTPSWLSVRSPVHLETIPDLDPGECEAISLARELSADILLIDEKAGREAAVARNLRTLRTTALLFEAANTGVLLDLKSAFEMLKATNFRVPPRVLDELLARHFESGSGQSSKRPGRAP